jgi:hypothetical protein
MKSTLPETFRLHNGRAGYDKLTSVASYGRIISLVL